MQVNTKLVKISAILIMALLLTSGIAPVVVKLQPHHVNPMIVSLGSSVEVTTAVQQLLKTFPTAKVIKFNFKTSLSVIRHSMHPIVWVGHGGPDGILINSQLYSWKVMARLIKLSPMKDYLLSCDSNQVLKFASLSFKQVFAFPDKIDAVLGALLIAYKLTGIQQLIGKLFDRFSMLFSGLSHPLFLSLIQCPPPSSTYVICGLGPHEAEWWVIQLAFLVLLILFNYYLPTGLGIVKETAIRFIRTGGPIQLFYDLVYLAHGWITVPRVVGHMLRYIKGFLGMFLAIFSAKSPWERWGIIAAMGANFFASAGLWIAELTGDLISGGGVTYLKILAAASVILYNAVLFLHDFTDPNDIVDV